MPNIPEIHLELLELWKRLIKTENSIFSAETLYITSAEHGLQYIPVNSSLLIINFQLAEYLKMPDLQTENISVGTKFTIMSALESNPASFFNWSMACGLEGNILQGYTTNPPVVGDNTEKNFKPGSIMEVIYIGSGKWRMLSFNDMASCYAPY